jgi:hypothetical protein
LVPRSAFKVNKGSFSPFIICDYETHCWCQLGTVKDYDAVALSGKINKHHFCTACGSSLFNYLEAMPDMTVIKAGCLDGGAASLDNKVAVEYFSKDRVDYLKEIPGAEQNPIF